VFDSKSIVELYRGWDRLEKSASGSQAYVIDFDLAPSEGSAEFQSRIEILEYLLQLRDSISVESSRDVFIYAKLNASIYYLRALMGEQIPFEEYVLNTMGVFPKLFSEQKIEAARASVCAHLADFGLGFDRSYKKDFENRFVLEDAAAIQKQLMESKELWLQRLREYVHFDDLGELNVSFVEVNEYWTNWISGSSRDGNFLQINLHPRNTIKRGEPVLLALHEICGHAVQMSLLRHNVKVGELEEAFGITTVHTPDQFITEGLAQTLPYILASEDELSQEVLLIRDLLAYESMVYSNAHYQINTGCPVKEVYEYLALRLPFVSPVSLESELRDRSRDPMFRSYQYVYAIAADFFRMALCPLDTKTKAYILAEIYTTPMTPKQLMQFIASV